MNLLNKNILFEHFAGRTSPLQKKLISAWLQVSDNQELYYRWLEDYENEYDFEEENDPYAYDEERRDSDEVDYPSTPSSVDQDAEERDSYDEEKDYFENEENEDDFSY